MDNDIQKKYGFSLVELSIVLVILGLLVGGILAGQSLIRAAELRHVTAQLHGFIAAHQSFRDKYMAVPGDMANATQFWGQVPGSVTICSRTQGTGTQTCNGDGSGFLETSGNGRYNEPARYWQHLANAGMITGSYSGVGSDSTTVQFTNADNSPTGKINNSLWFAYSDPFGMHDSPMHYLFGTQSIDNSQGANGIVLRPEQLWNLDSKMDDGKPNTGKVQGAVNNPTPNHCSTGSTATDTYILNYTDIACYAYLYFE